MEAEGLESSSKKQVKPGSLNTNCGPKHSESAILACVLVFPHCLEGET